MKKLLGILVFVALQVFLLELILSVFFSLHQDYDAEMWKYTRDLKANVPDPRGHVHALSGSAKLMGVKVRTNSLGHRGPEPKPGARHLLVAGDSFTLGWGVEEEATYSALLQNECPGREVANLGVGNYNLEQVAASVEAWGPELNPAAVLYGFYWNDAEPLQHEPDSWLARHSHLALFWRKIQVRLLHYGGKPQSFLDYYRETYEGESWERFQAAAGRLAAFAKGRGLKLHVVLLPELRTPDDPDIRAVYAKVETLFRGLGAETLNLFGKLPPAAKPEAYWVAPDDPHPNALAHKAIAEALTKSFWPNCKSF